MKCGVAIAVTPRGVLSILISLSTWYTSDCGVRHPSEEEISQAKESDISNFIEGEESLPGIPPGNPLASVNFISKVGCTLG